MNLASVSKALAGAAASGLATLQMSQLDNSAAGQSITANEWITAGIAAGIAFVAVYAIPNVPKAL